MNSDKLEIVEQFDLKDFTTMRVPALCKYFVRVHSVEQVRELFRLLPEMKTNFLCLGEGSNILFVNSFEGIILKNEIQGFEILNETSERVRVRVGAGMLWHSFVLNCLQMGWGGVENLSLIPGTVGAAPIQNIGAYGVEVKEVIEAVECYDVDKDCSFSLSKKDCEFGYRDSVFKKEGKGKWIVTAVLFELSKNHQINTSYGALQGELSRRAIAHPTVKDISDVVIAIRESKLPDPKKIGNAGSFFKNPVVSAEKFLELKSQHHHLVAYPEGEGKVKLAAGWLIEQCGLKGWRMGSCGVHSSQALVLVNHGGATGKQIFELATFVRDKVFEKFRIHLEMEVQII